MKVSILASDLSSNAMGRVFVLARILARRHEVEVVGPTFGRDLWPPIAGEGLDIKAIEISESPRSIPRMLRIARVPAGDVIYACKPVWSSFGVALQARAHRERPVVLDIDDWEWGFSRYAIRSARNKLRYMVAAALHPHLPNAWPSALLFDRVTSRADAITVSNSFLRDRFGGAIVWHGRDTDLFDPARYPVEEARRQLGLALDERIVMFFGTIQPYKGVEDLIHAVAALDRGGVRLVLAGAGDTDAARAAVEMARAQLGPRATVIGTQPFARVPQIIAAADVVVVPQQRTSATRGQMPAKLFDAMAMAKPIVATRVSDIPRVLDGCGWVVEPDSPAALTTAIREVLDDPARAASMAAAARRKCVAEYSWNAMEKTLANVFERIGRAN